MKQFYVIPTTTLSANPPDGGWHAIPTPANPNISVVVVQYWNSHATQDAWEALPGVIELTIEMLGNPAHPAAVTAFAPWGATAGMTLRQVFQLVRQKWSVFRH